jgi:phosphatidylinositol-3,4,5-trisphosphate 3-phosphatase/dual-specificity protein phosphatase PTEN
MFSLVRKVVAGPKRTTRYEGEDLDLTYITDRVIAMAFPASDMIEKTYRNNIEDVSGYFDENHPEHYLIVNVSSRSYDYSAFGNRVRDYEWPDHQTPPFTTLVQVAFDMYRFLKGTCGCMQVRAGGWWRCTATTARGVRARL